MRNPRGAVPRWGTHSSWRLLAEPGVGVASVKLKSVLRGRGDRQPPPDRRGWIARVRGPFKKLIHQRSSRGVTACSGVGSRLDDQPKTRVIVLRTATTTATSAPRPTTTMGA
jgi:hypothetical protein